MNPQVLLRVLVIAIGLFVLSGGLTSAFSSAWSLWKLGYLPSESRDYYVSVFIGYGVVPTLLGGVFTLFPKRIVAALFGRTPHPENGSIPMTPQLIVFCAIRLIGLYFLCTHGSAMAATFFEMVALRAGNTQFEESKIMADTVANGTGIGIALLLCLRTSHIFRIIFEKGEKG